MDQQATKNEIKTLKAIEESLEKAQKKQQEVNKVFESIIPLDQKLEELTKNIFQIIILLQEASPVVERFSRKVAFYSRERVVEIEGKNTIQPIEKRTLVVNSLNPNLGLLEHAVVEQIEIIDSEKKQTSTYEQINEALSTRIYYTNKTMDLCIDYLLKNL